MEKQMQEQFENEELARRARLMSGVSGMSGMSSGGNDSVEFKE
tara:strand:- start:1673 stop:1801 length:129 start_codon:yes stop_codon:yes gene_type:complete